jgi:hypothetical protein
MGINQTWFTTLSFREFRIKTHQLSEVYWTQQMAVDCLKENLLTKNPDDVSSQVINCSFESKMFGQTVQETIDWLPKFMERNRLHLLVIYTAFLETYLKEITFYHCASQGNIANRTETSSPIKLNAVGTALTAPILKSSTVPDMIKFASEYYDIDFGVNAVEWIKIYKIRCAAAHNGGIATPNFLKAISGQPLALRPNVYENIGLTWDELRTFMRYADEIAAMIDIKVSNYDVKKAEVEEVFRELKSTSSLPKQSKLWEFLHDEYAFQGIKRVDKNDFIRRFY